MVRHTWNGEGDASMNSHNPAAEAATAELGMIRP
jgi:hypothetical protein